ncbi:ferredoxin [Actinomadura harenae]|uniref:Ferredoxin n=1 Tax=Actinomadura harenae TaxID=2483351 RepID=A0A3M2ME05_9ACTN|nr:ferredoxin [Actinomadura harenae]RMI46855.1 ferredoxin [Actinomadura harenae]
MRITVDLDLCQGHGMCELEAPDVFEVPNRSTVRILDPEPGEEHRDEVAAAVRYCPAQALRMEE